jgi:hypothetical protein
MSEKIPNDNTDPIWKTHMETLMKKKRIIETKEIIEQSLFQYYLEKGMNVPNWKVEKNPDWWTDYLRELSGDHKDNDDW